FRRLNQRMHSKLLLIDGQLGITGGRNYQDDYYDWDAEYNFRDRDLLVAGPTADDMLANFQAFWVATRSVPIERLDDVGRRLLRSGVPALPPATPAHPQRVQAALRAAADPARMQQLAATALPVGGVQFVADLPRKHRRDAPAPTDVPATAASAPSTAVLRDLIESAQREVLLQTPYLVLSPPAQQLFRDLHDRENSPRVVVSTNSLAATDAFFVYALSHKYKRRYLRDFGFEIYEYKPFPTDVPGLPSPLAAIAEAPTDPATPADPANPADPDVVSAPPPLRRAPARAPVDRRSVQAQAQRGVAQRRAYLASRAGNRPVPLRRDGARMGLHSKSLVIDQRIGVVGTHNFDPRGDRYNTENAVIIDDPVFAQALAASIRRDMAPGNSWVIAPRDKLPLLSGLEYSLGKISEHLPLFDLWPTRYATSYEFVAGPSCPAPLPPDHPRFRVCYRPVGDFPEVALGFKSLTTRIFTAFGAGLAPVL
ncbi:MAG TPA: phospholipase D-like domain-containing protein, partial [Xanthomonadaceae bacterium]|nr:phospholipase D-like domain-containing protein [Xanthomonadaceae bacterium]